VAHFAEVRGLGHPAFGIEPTVTVSIGVSASQSPCRQAADPAARLKYPGEQLRVLPM
jgi:hypothetical protein